jgi:hypothetical protein
MHAGTAEICLINNPFCEKDKEINKNSAKLNYAKCFLECEVTHCFG